MKCCVSTDVGTWTNWLTFEPDPDHSPDAGIGKSMICRSPSNRHLTQSMLQVTWCTAERYCLLRVLVQGPGSFAYLVDFLYDARLRSYGASKLPNFRILAYFPPYKTSLQPILVSYIAEWLRFFDVVVKRELWSLLTTYRKSYMGFSKNPLPDP